MVLLFMFSPIQNAIGNSTFTGPGYLASGGSRTYPLSVSATFNNPVTQGSLLLVVVTCQCVQTGNYINAFSVQDTKGSVYTTALELDNTHGDPSTPNFGIVVFFVNNVPTGSTTITVNATAGSTNPFFGDTWNLNLVVVELPEFSSPSVQSSASAQIGGTTQAATLTIADSNGTSVTSAFENSTGSNSLTGCSIAVVDLLSHSPSQEDFFIGVFTGVSSKAPLVSPSNYMLYDFIQSVSQSPGLSLYLRSPRSVNIQPVMSIIT